MPAEVKVKKGHSWSEQVGIAVRALQEGENEELVVWTKDVSIHHAHMHDTCTQQPAQLLMMAYGQRQRIVDEVDGIRDEPPAEAEEEVDGDIQVEDAELEAKRRLDGPSDDAREKFEDYCEQIELYFSFAMLTIALSYTIYHR
jgi:replication fork protection complex subunit Tof1/Swi1